MPFALSVFRSDEPGIPDVAGIVISVGRPLPIAEPMFEVMHKAGWVPMELPVSVPVSDAGHRPVATARIGEGGVKLLTKTSVNGGVIDDEPIGRMSRAPEGWWDAVAANSDCCVMVMTDRIDLVEAADGMLAVLAAATARGATLSAVANVIRAYP